MYSKKFRLTDIRRQSERNKGFYDSIKGNICYLGFFKIGERGWFLVDEMQGFEPVHRVHTSEVKDVKYEENGNIIVVTENTTYTFEIEG